LDEITTKARQVDELIAEIAVASQEQSQGIDQVSRAVSDMDRVTQANAATAEETSAAAAELDNQTAQLKAVIRELIQMVNGSNFAEADLNLVPVVAQKHVAPVKAPAKPVSAHSAHAPAQKPAARARVTPPSHEPAANGKNPTAHNSIPNRNSHTESAGDDSERFFKDV